MSVLEPAEIHLDKPRHLRLTHQALFDAERQVNKMRGAKPEDYVSIYTIMVRDFNRILAQQGIPPHDLIVCLLWAGLRHEQANLQIDQIGDLIDRSPLDLGEICGRIWGAFFAHAGKGVLRAASEADAEKKTTDPTATTGSTGGPSDGLN